MQVFYEVMKGFFFFATIVVAIIFLRGEFFRGAEHSTRIISLIIPGYLVFCGIIIGYIVSHLSSAGSNPKKTSVVSFIVGITIGIVLALSYILI